jgi:integration host factor subunit beta
MLASRMMIHPNRDGREAVSEIKPTVASDVDNECSAVEPVMTHEQKLQIARILYRMMVGKYPGRFVALRDNEQVLARSDRPEMMPPLF